MPSDGLPRTRTLVDLTAVGVRLEREVAPDIEREPDAQAKATEHRA